MIGHADLGIALHLFVRERPKLEGGKAAPLFWQMSTDHSSDDGLLGHLPSGPMEQYGPSGFRRTLLNSNAAKKPPNLHAHSASVGPRIRFARIRECRLSLLGDAPRQEYNGG